MDCWMGNLSSEKRQLPLHNVKIPGLIFLAKAVIDVTASGSHDSFTFALDTNMDMANDIPDMVKGMPQIPTIKQIICNWSRTQSLSTSEQLDAGSMTSVPCLTYCRQVCATLTCACRCRRAPPLKRMPCAQCTGCTRNRSATLSMKYVNGCARIRQRLHICVCESHSLRIFTGCLVRLQPLLQHRHRLTQATTGGNQATL